MVTIWVSDRSNRQEQLYKLQMASRHRSLRDRRMIPSSSEPDCLRSHKAPLLLPHIKSNRPSFYDQIVLSPDFVQISKTQKTQTSRLPQSLSLSTSRARSIVVSQKDRSLYEKYAQEDRVVQRYEQQIEKYKRRMQQIHRRSVQRQRLKHKGGLSLIYQRLMGML